MEIPFNSSDHSSLGVEMELAIVDRETRELRGAASEILPALGHPHPEGAPHTKAKHELMESTIEVITSICSSVEEARADLESTLGEITGLTEPKGLALMCAGTHPFSHWRDQAISPNPRYERLLNEMQWPARQLQIFGIHVHVGVRSPEKAIAIANALSTYVPHLLALSASSPFWLGYDTGLASCRTKIFELLPTAGLPYQLADWSEFEEFMSTLVSAQAISSIREVWWDIRPHPNFGTIEVRICDGIPTMSEVCALVAMSLCLVDWMDTLHDRGYTLPCPKAWVVRENKWRAARHGVDAQIISDETGNLQPLQEAIRHTVEELTPTATRLGCLEELQYALRIMEFGPSYVRQRGVVEAGGSLIDVVDTLVEELRTDKPTGS
ncbi:MAG: glutamate--cysteine ligase [Actinomycetota bacterium]|nr:glutamate--cysteine ligase [Actinomycetota bacterium]